MVVVGECMADGVVEIQVSTAQAAVVTESRDAGVVAIDILPALTPLESSMIGALVTARRADGCTSGAGVAAICMIISSYLRFNVEWS